MEWINTLVAALCSLLGAFGGGGILYWQYNKKLKAIEVVHNQADEWKRLYDEVDEEKKKLTDKVSKLYQDRYNLQTENAKKDLEIQKLKWYHCTINGCKNRKPPHVFDMSGNEISITEEAKNADIK